LGELLQAGELDVARDRPIRGVAAVAGNEMGKPRGERVRRHFVLTRTGNHIVGARIDAARRDRSFRRGVAEDHPVVEVKPVQWGRGRERIANLKSGEADARYITICLSDLILTALREESIHLKYNMML
jgi:hypothetical protein